MMINWETFTFLDKNIVFTQPPIQSVCLTEQNMRWTDLSPNESKRKRKIIKKYTRGKLSCGRVKMKIRRTRVIKWGRGVGANRALRGDPVIMSYHVAKWKWKKGYRIEWEEKRPIAQLQCLGAPPVAMSHTHSAFIIFSSSSSLFLKESKRTTFLLICVLGVTSGSFPYLMSDTRPQN